MNNLYTKRTIGRRKVKSISKQREKILNSFESTHTCKKDPIPLGLKIMYIISGVIILGIILLNILK